MRQASFVLVLSLWGCSSSQSAPGPSGPDAALPAAEGGISDAALPDDGASLDGVGGPETSVHPGDSGVDAAPLTCSDGSPALFDRRSCPGPATPAPTSLVTAVSSATRGDIVSLGGFDEPTAPCVPVLVCAPSGAATMIFSDDPESPSSDGVLYADVIGPGKIRVYVYHTNGGAGLRKFPVVLLNQGSVDVHAVIGPKGVAGPSTDYVGVGKAAILAWLGSVTPTSVTVPAGQRVLLDMDLDAVHAGTNELAHAILDVALDGPVKLSVISLGATGDAVTAAAGLSVLANDGLHVRGTFPGADLRIEASAPLDAASARRLRLGDGVTDVPLPGKDAVDGTAATLGGNYGVAYDLRMSTAAGAAFVISPRGGAWGGAAQISAGQDAPAETLTPLPSSTSSLGADTQAILVGRFAAGSAPQMRLMSAGGSNLGVDLLAVPLP